MGSVGATGGPDGEDFGARGTVAGDDEIGSDEGVGGEVDGVTDATADAAGSGSVGLAGGALGGRGGAMLTGREVDAGREGSVAGALTGLAASEGGGRGGGRFAVFEGTAASAT